MSTQVQFRRGNTSQTSTFTGAMGEITVDTDKDTLVVHDGALAGGYPLARESSLSANAIFTQAAFNQANTANTRAYNTVLKSGDTVTGQLNVTAGISSTSNTTGTLVVVGGVGVAGNVYANSVYINNVIAATIGDALALSIALG